MEAEYICDVFEKGEVDRIYLNFSDPWPKDRHAKRRLTSKQFFERYDVAGWELIEQTWDLHNDERLMQGNVMTEYESKFSQMGNPIHKLIAKR